MLTIYFPLVGNNRSGANNLYSFNFPCQRNFKKKKRIAYSSAYTHISFKKMNILLVPMTIWNWFRFKRGASLRRGDEKDIQEHLQWLSRLTH
jgi:hypothetical protein